VALFVAGIFFLIRTTSPSRRVSTESDDRQTAEFSVFGIPIGRVSLSLGVVLVAMSAALVALGLPGIEAVQHANQIAALEGDKTTLNERIGKRDATIETLNGTISAKDERISKLEEATQSASVTIRERNGEISRLENVIERKDKLLSELGDTIRQATALIQTATREKAALLEKLRSAEAEAANAVQVARDVASAVGEARLSESEREELRRVREGIGAINTELSYVALREAPLLEIVGRLGVANYEIYARRFAENEGDALDRGFGLFEFESERFTLENQYGEGEMERLLEEIAPAICDAVNASIAGDVSLEDAIRRISALEKYEGLPEQLVVLAEYAYLRLQLQALAVDAEIFVRGYADGERSDWSRALPSRSPDRIDLHPLANPDAGTPLGEWRFLDPTVTRPIGDRTGNYRNGDLPNLRSLTTRALMDEVIAGCSLPGQEPNGLGTRSAVLEGKLDDAHGGVDRKSRAFVSITLR